MKISKIKKLPMIFTLMLALAFSLVCTSNAFADVFPGPNHEYCTIIYQSLDGDAYNSTASNPIGGVRSYDSPNIIGTTGSLPLVIEFSSTCQEYMIIAHEIDSEGNQVGDINISPWVPITGEGTVMHGPNTQNALPPAEWFTPGKLYKVYSFGLFPNLYGGVAPGSSAFYRIVN
ncbi:MAG TPA: hypothetical protein GX523_07675 [Desulfitobacterium dehalogenans]|uniref:Uncharacterized protein n=1 Tax=Desulfitobacterium dehalogenans TaxID=36854 RepID=A0A7C7D5D1_9FIRM|nr:hypothetical protein [Desulfitobacterium dehalogenans]